ncbi:MAG: RsmE family RNA methyltransferase [Gemmatimonadales bacterium]|nr:RsmE family RNA methyltransferase [Gemmatimonadales bacterium]
MIRLLVPVGALVQGVSVRVDDDEAHHLDVRRVADGSEVEALDGAGARAVGVVQRDGKRWHLRVESMVQEARPRELLLAVGGGDKDRFLWLAEKATELGVTTLVPIETTRSRHVENRLRPGTIEKARRRVREACKQSGNPWAPTIADVEPIDGLGQRYPGLSWWLADAAGGAAPAGIGAAAIGWLIGPEGGFVADDLTILERDLAPVRVTLGVHVLRFETAAIAAAVLTADRRRS